MPGTTVPLTGMLNGYPGTVTRNGDEVIAARAVRSTDTVNVNFGDPLVLNGDSTGGTWSSVAGFITAGGTITTGTQIVAVAVRQVQTALQYPPTSGVGYYTPGQIADGLERGSIAVQLHVYSTAPVAGGPVYVRIALNGAIPAGVVGGFETAADGSNTVEVANMVFRTGVIDANGVAEITLLTREAA